MDAEVSLIPGPGGEGSTSLMPVLGGEGSTSLMPVFVPGGKGAQGLLPLSGAAHQRGQGHVFRMMVLTYFGPRRWLRRVVNVSLAPFAFSGITLPGA